MIKKFGLSVLAIALFLAGLLMCFSAMLVIKGTHSNYTLAAGSLVAIILALGVVAWWWAVRVLRMIGKDAGL